MKNFSRWHRKLIGGLALFLTGGILSAQSLYQAGVSAGYGNVLAAWCDGSAWAAGGNSEGQLGSGNLSNSPVLINVLGLSNGVVSVQAGYGFGLALTSDGLVHGFGDNSDGQCGTLVAGPVLTNVLVTNLTGVVAISAGAAHGLALLSTNGLVRAFGWNANGQCGDGTTVNRTNSVAVTNLSSITAVAAGGYHSLFLSNSNVVYACGYNLYGECGDGTTTQRKTPVLVTNLCGVTAIAAGAYHSLTLMSNGCLKSFGYNFYGQLGDSTTSNRKTNVAVVGLSNVVAISAGWSHSLALCRDGSVRAWGMNSVGQLGDGTLIQRNTNVVVVGLSNVIAIAAGGNHSVAVEADGTCWIWGYTNYGLNTGGYSAVPVNVQPAVHLTWLRPTIVRQPENQAVLIWNTAAFKVTATGTPPLYYQWSFNGAPIAGATSNILTFTSQPSAAGNYSVQVSNAVGAVTSATATFSCFNWNGSIPSLPAGDILGTWNCDDSDFLEYYTGFGPILDTNVFCVPDWSGNAVQVDSASPAILQYPCTAYDEYGSWELLSCTNGTVAMWVSPNWSSASLGGTGPGDAGRLIEVGTQGGTNDWWSLYLNPAGTMLTFSVATNGVQSDLVTAPISWYSNEWYHVALLYPSDGSSSSLYLGLYSRICGSISKSFECNNRCVNWLRR